MWQCSETLKPGTDVGITSAHATYMVLPNNQDLSQEDNDKTQAGGGWAGASCVVFQLGMSYLEEAPA